MPNTRKEQDTLSKTSPEKAIDDITSDIRAAPMTTMASKQRIWIMMEETLLGVEGSDDVNETPEVAEKSQSREDGGDNIIACKSFHFDDILARLMQIPD